MGDWERVVIPDKGHFAGRPWIFGDLSGVLAFANYDAPYNDVAITGDDEHQHADDFVGYRIDNFNNFIQEVGIVSNYLIAAWNVNPQGGESGAYLCMLMDISNHVITETSTTVRIKIQITKRLYDYAGTHYTESYPLGTYFQEADYTLRSTTAPDNRQGLGFVLFFKKATYSTELNYVIGLAHILKSGDTICYGSSRGFRMKASWFKSSDGWGANAEIPETDGGESPEFGPASEPEGYEPTGGFNDSSDLIDMPSKPQSVLSLGFVNVYKCDAGALTQFGAELFPEIQFPSSLSDVGAVLAAVSDSIWNSKLIDYVISVHCVPGNVTGGNLTDIKVGTRTMTGIMGRPITDEYVDFDFGSVTVDPFYKNYADYFTEVQLFLPMYGFVSLRPEEVIGGEVQVKYRFNVIDGSFMAYVFATSNRSKLYKSVIGQYGGSCVVHLPVSNVSYASMFSGLIGAGAGVGMGIATGGTAAAVSASLSATNGVIQAAQGADVKKSNSYNASSSFMSRRKPYLIVTRPVSSFSTRYNIENGLPSNVAMTIGECVGFTQADNVVLDAIPCTEAEKTRIRSLLASGVIVK